MISLGFAGNPYFEVAVGLSGGTITAVGMVGIYSDGNGSQKYSYTQDPFTLGGFEFILNIPKAQNTHPWWNDIDRMISVTFKGIDNLDTQGGGASPYNPRRIANDTKKIKDLVPNLKKVDNTIPNGTGDATYTRQLVQKNDGTIGWENKVTIIDSVYVEKQAFVAEYNRTSDYITIGFMLRSKYPNVSLPSVSKVFISMYGTSPSLGDGKQFGGGHDLTTAAILNWGYVGGGAHESGNRGLLSGTIKIPSVSTEVSYLQSFGYNPISITILLNITMGGVTKQVAFTVPFM